MASSYQLSPEQVEQALAAAQRVVQGEAAWVWDEQAIDWQANEVELLYEGKTLRIDRLVKRRDTQTWWVIDFKSAQSPELNAALRAQIAEYQRAVQSAYPQASVKAAFITAHGRWIE